jgi:hypothetical protein
VSPSSYDRVRLRKQDQPNDKAPGIAWERVKLVVNEYDILDMQAVMLWHTDTLGSQLLAVSRSHTNLFYRQRFLHKAR